jgi:transcriptional regulator with PAS, ATPase and Fis domain
LERLAAHQWPGNVRELENAVELAVAMSGNRKNLVQSDFPLEGIEQFGSAPIELPASGFDFDEFMTQLQRTLIDQAMLKARGNQTVAAGLLGMKRTTLISRHKALSSCA